MNDSAKEIGHLTALNTAGFLAGLLQCDGCPGAFFPHRPALGTEPRKPERMVQPAPLLLWYPVPKGTVLSHPFSLWGSDVPRKYVSHSGRSMELCQWELQLDP